MELNQTIIKELIYRHRLYPILTLIFQRCELATVTLNPDFNFNDDLIYLLNKNGQEQHKKIQCGQQTNYSPQAAAMGLTIDEQQLLQQSNNNNNITPTTTAAILTTELDEFLQHAIQVLYIHLLELEKVHELCTEFCSKYIQCLKGKLIKQRKETIGILDEIEEQGEEEDRFDQEEEINANNSTYHFATTGGERSIVDSCQVPNNYESPTMAGSDQHQLTTATNPYFHATTSAMMPNMRSIQSSDDDDGNSSTTSPPTTSKRSLFTKQATAQLRNWLFTHLSHPYPTEQEKQQLSDLTGLNILQVNNWFINARRRIVQPLIDRENRVGLMRVSATNSDDGEINK